MRTLEELLKRKLKIARILYKLAVSLRKKIKEDKIQNMVFYISRRERILNELSRVDAELEKLFLINKKNTKNLGEIIKNLNLLFNELIKTEKENEILLNKTLELKTGNYINNYKKFSK